MPLVMRIITIAFVESSGKIEIIYKKYNRLLGRIVDSLIIKTNEERISIQTPNGQNGKI